MNGCPCKYTTPCSERCTCVNPVSSAGCSRCVSYGSISQRKAYAPKLATKIDGTELQSAEAKLAVMAEKLKNLIAEAGGCAELARQCIGNTNTSVLLLRVKEAEDVLAQLPERAQRLQAVLDAAIKCVHIPDNEEMEALTKAVRAYQGDSDG